VEDDEKFDGYMSRLRKDGEWGGHQELYAASRLLGCSIVVHQFNAPMYFFFFFFHVDLKIKYLIKEEAKIMIFFVFPVLDFRTFLLF
jgi:hypothetical protein